MVIIVNAYLSTCQNQVSFFARVPRVRMDSVRWLWGSLEDDGCKTNKVLSCVTASHQFDGLVALNVSTWVVLPLTSYATAHVHREL